MVLKTEESHDLLSQGWKTRKGKDTTVWVWRPENWGMRENQQCKSKSEFKWPKIRKVTVWVQEELDISAQTECKFILPPPFCYLQDLNRLDSALPPWRGHYFFLSPLVQMLISLRDILTNTPRNNVYQLPGNCLDKSIWPKI